MIKYLVVGIFTSESGIEFQKMAKPFDDVKEAEKFRVDLLKSEYFSTFYPSNIHVLHFNDGK